MEKIVSQLDAAGYYVCPSVADESPEEPGKFLIPGGCVDLLPPDELPGKRYRHDGEGWIEEDIPSLPEPEPDLEPEPDRKAQILAELADIDASSIRPSREIAVAIASSASVPEFAASKLASLEARAHALRLELATL